MNGIDARGERRTGAPDDRPAPSRGPSAEGSRRTAEPAYDAIVLAGGGSIRLGQDKTRVDVSGRVVLDRVLGAVAGADTIVAVGPSRPVHGPQTNLRWTREHPPGGGPAAGVAAAARLLGRPWVVVLAGDVPLVTANTVQRLLAAVTSSMDPRSAGAGTDTSGYGSTARHGAVLVDAGGRRQHLLLALRTRLLQARANERDWHGASMHELLTRFALVEVPAVGSETRDVDDLSDLEEIRHLGVPGDPDDRADLDRGGPDVDDHHCGDHNRRADRDRRNRRDHDRADHDHDRLAASPAQDDVR